MQEVHTYRRLGVPPTSARTRWTFGFQRRRVRRCECETLLPKPGLLPQMSQTEATVRSMVEGSIRQPSKLTRSRPRARTKSNVPAPFYAARCDHAPRTA